MRLWRALLHLMRFNHRTLLCFSVGLGIAALTAGSGAAQAQESRLDAILKRDKLVVAVSNSTMPTGFIDENGTHTGFEIEFARLLAKSILGSPDKIEFVVVNAAGRFPAVLSGRVDFGIGVGWNKEEVEACGYRWEDRGARCNEFLEVMRRLWTEPVVDFKGKWVKFETMRLDPKPIQKPHVPIIVGGYADQAFDRAVKFGAGWYGFNLDPARTKGMLAKLDAAFAKAGKKRDKKFEIIVTPPMTTTADALPGYAELGVDRLVVNLGGQRPEQVDKRLPEIDTWVKKAA